MKGNSPKAGKAAWKGTCVFCSAIVEFLYSFLVIVLAGLVASLAYLATLDEIELPNFILQKLEGQLERQGVDLKMQSLRFHPDGRIVVESPILSLTALREPIFSADHIEAKIDLPLLLLNKVRLEKLSLSNGAFYSPAIVSPSGLKETIAKSVSCDIRLHHGKWRIAFANIQIFNTKCHLTGELKSDILTTSEAEPAKDFKSVYLSALPKLWEIHRYAQRAAKPILSAELSIDEKDNQEARILIAAQSLDLPKPSFSSKATHAMLRINERLGMQAALKLTALQVMQEAAIGEVDAMLSWDAFPHRETWLPQSGQAYASGLEYGENAVPFALFRGAQAENTHWQARIDADIARQAWRIEGQIDPATQAGSFKAGGLAGPEAIAWASALTVQDFSDFASIAKPAQLEIEAKFSSLREIAAAKAFLDAGPVTAKGTVFERATGYAALQGPEVSVNNLWIQSGAQSGWIGIAYNTQTQRRRFLVEGDLNPQSINEWFKPWWKKVWDNFQFPAKGAYTLLDARSTRGKPHDTWITGLARCSDFGIRSEPMDTLRTRFHVLFRYVDFYDLQLTSPKGDAQGEIQFSTARDPRDQKVKLTGLWIDTVSDLDVALAPKLLTEVEAQAAHLIAPYKYDSRPHLVAKSSSTRHSDHFRNDIELDIATGQPIAFYHFPFDSLQAKVAIKDEAITICDGEAGIGGGKLSVEADVVDEKVALEVALQDADFGEALLATASYLNARDAAAGIEPSRDTEKLQQFEGQMNGAFSGKGILGNRLSYEGEGQAHVTEASLGEIQLFGLLSKMLEPTLLRFTTLKFNEIEGPFAVRKEKLLFPDLEITGPSAVVESSGHYDLEQHALDFNATLFPFRKSKMPVIALMGVVLSPVSRFMEARLTGSLSEPKWSLFSPSPEPVATTESDS